MLLTVKLRLLPQDRGLPYSFICSNMHGPGLGPEEAAWYSVLDSGQELATENAKANFKWFN